MKTTLGRALTVVALSTVAVAGIGVGSANAMPVNCLGIENTIATAEYMRDTYQFGSAGWRSWQEIYLRAVKNHGLYC